MRSSISYKTKSTDNTEQQPEMQFCYRVYQYTYVTASLAIVNLFSQSLCNISDEVLDYCVNKKLSYRKETVQLLHNIEIRVLH